MTAHTPFGDTTTARRDWACFLQACSEGHDPDGVLRFHEMWARCLQSLCLPTSSTREQRRKDLKWIVEHAVLEVYL